jgi:heme-degrading monooxygenase HmoA
MIRIVKMIFRENDTDKFLEIFKHAKPLIENFEGCRGVTLLQDINQKQVFFTYSRWEGPQYLEAYRNSDLFAETWVQTKSLFAGKPEAWSVEETA